MMNHVISAVCLGLLLSTAVTGSLPDFCLLPAKTGMCRANMPMFYYNAAAQRCMKFTYGGCGGNANRFGTRLECQQRCSPVNVCTLPKATGRCRARVELYYYNTETGRCELFVYGGCRGNANRFGTLQECMDTCAGF